MNSEATGDASIHDSPKFSERETRLTRHNVALGYAELMGRFRLPLFLTQTFANRSHPEAVGKAHRYTLALLNNDLHGKNWRRKGITGAQSILGIERHKSGYPHSHAVVGHPTVDLGALEHSALRAALRARCEAEWGFARLEVATSAAEVNAYVSKYVVKDGDLWISDHIETLNSPQLALTYPGLAGRRS